MKKRLQIPLHEILLATNRFAKENLIGEGGFGTVYKGISEKHGCIAVKRLVHRPKGQGDPEFKREIAMLSRCKHENIVSLLGFCVQDGEKILVYKYESNGSLDKHLKSQNLSWVQRLWICLDVACALKYLHDDVEPLHGILHRDVKSSNILLDANWKAKISDFGLSREGPESSFVFSNACGTHGYIDPYYKNNCYLTPKADVYSFGVVLLEVLCGRPAVVTSYDDNHKFLALLVEKKYNRETLDAIIPSYLLKQISSDSLDKFSKIAYQCLKNIEERPTMKQVVEQLQEAIHIQLEVKKTKRNKVEGETKAAARDDKKGTESKEPLPSPLSQEFVLSTFLHCEGCATKLQRCLKGFEGVEKVRTDYKTHKVVVKGKNLDQLKVIEKVQNKIRQKVDLLWPVPKPSCDEPNKKLEQEKPPTHEEKKDPEMQLQVITVVLEVPMHCDCEGCAKKIKRCIRKMKGVERVVMDVYNSQVVVKGTFSAAELVDYVYKETGKRSVIAKQDPI